VKPIRFLICAVFLMMVASQMSARAQEAAPVPPPSADVVRLLGEAKESLSHGDANGALQKYKEVLAKEPDNIVALYFAGNLSLQLRQVKPGLTYLARAAVLAPNDPRVWLVLGRAYEQFATPEDAMRVYKHIVESAPKSPQAAEADKRLRLLAEKRIAPLEHPEQAQQKPAPPSSGDITKLLGEAKESLSHGDANGALQKYKEVLAKEPDNIVALYFAGNLSLQLKQVKPGLTYLAHAANLSPNDPRVWLVLGRAYEQYATPEDAMRVYRHILQSAPKSPQAAEADKHLRLLSGKQMASLGHPKQAQQILENLLNDYPKDPSVLTEINAINRAIEQTRSTAAAQTTPEKLKEAEELAAKDIPSLLAEGKKALERNDAKTALQIYEAVLTKDSDNIEALFFAANLYFAMKRPDPGLKYLARAVTILPSNVRLRMSLAKAYEQFNFLEQATDEYQNVAKLSPNSEEATEANKRIALLSGRIALKQGRTDEAVEIFSKLKAQYPNDPEVLAGIDAANRTKTLGQGQIERGGEAKPAPSVPPEIAQQLADARVLLKKNDFLGALKLYEAVIKKEPNNFEALYFAGSIYLLGKNVRQGLQYMTKCVTLQPGNIKLRLSLAQNYERYGFLGDALREYGNIVAQSIDSPEGQEANLHFQLLSGMRALQTGKEDDSLKIFESLFRLYPQNPGALTEVVNAYLTAKRSDYAKKLLENILSVNPGNTPAHYFLADIDEHLGDLPSAIGHYGIVVKQLPPANPQRKEAGLKMTMLAGALAIQKADYGEAKRQFEQAAAIDPKSGLAKLDLAISLKHLGDTAKAEDTLLDALQQNPDYLPARIKLAEFYVQDGRMDFAALQLEETRIRGIGSREATTANEALSRIYSVAEGRKIRDKVQASIINTEKERLAQSPNDYGAWAKLARIYSVFGKKAETLDAYENIVRLNPNNTRALEILAGLYDENNDLAKAGEAYTRALDNTRDPAARRQIEEKLDTVYGKKAFNEKNLKVAEAKFKEVVTANPRNYSAYFYLGIIHTMDEQYDQAARDYEDVIKIVPAHGVARFRLGLIYEQLKRDEDALAQYRAMLGLSLDKQLTDAAKREIDVVEKRIQGFDFSANYSVNYISNRNLTKLNPLPEISFNLSGSINFHHKLHLRPVTLGISLNPFYTTNNAAHTDNLGGSLTTYALYSWGDLSFSDYLSYSESSDFSLDQTISKSYNFSGDVSEPIKMVALIPWFAPKEERGQTPTVWRFNYSANKYKVSEGALLDINTYSLGFTLSQSSSKGWRWSGGYTFTKSDPTSDIGSDYAYISHGLNFQLLKSLTPRLSAFGGYSYTRQFYENPDSFTLFTKKRRSGSHSINLGLNYLIDPNLRVFFQAGYTLNRTNLPIGFIVSEQNFGIIGAQTPTLGAYSNITATAGVAFTF
jgi:tetratricopeptide (TPR) repeat protein